jgi:hypothetical protein
MAYVVLAGKGKGLIGIPDEDLAQVSIKDKLHTFDLDVKAAYDHKWPDMPLAEAGAIFDSSKDGVQAPYNDEYPSLEMHNFTHEEMDEYLSKELYLPRGGELATARVIRRSRDWDVPTVSRNSNSILDTQQYEVKFLDGSVDTYTANLIAENLATMIDPEGQQYALFKGIVYH